MSHGPLRRASSPSCMWIVCSLPPGHPLETQWPQLFHQPVWQWPSLCRLQPPLLRYNVVVPFFDPSLASWDFSAAVVWDAAKISDTNCLGLGHTSQVKGRRCPHCQHQLQIQGSPDRPHVVSAVHKFGSSQCPLRFFFCLLVNWLHRVLVWADQDWTQAPCIGSPES